MYLNKDAHEFSDNSVAITRERGMMGAEGARV